MDRPYIILQYEMKKNVMKIYSSVVMTQNYLINYKKTWGSIVPAVHVDQEKSSMFLPIWTIPSNTGKNSFPCSPNLYFLAILWFF